MGILLFSILCILILIARPSGPLTLAGLDESIDGKGASAVTSHPGQFRPEDSWEPEMPMTWLVHDTRGFWEGRTLAGDHSIELHLTYQEWLAIFFDALGIDKSAFDEMAASRAALGQPKALLTELDGEVVPGFPMLSRIQGPFHDAVFEANEVDALRQECLQVQTKTSNPLAMEGIRKLLLICDRAQELGLSIYLISNAS